MPMSQNFIKTATLTAGIASCAILLLAGGIYLFTPGDIVVSEAEAKPRILPKNAFRQPSDAYATISNTLQLKFGTPSLQLPNLRNALVYYGKGGRPDIPKEGAELHFTLAGGKDQASVTPGKKLYLMFNRSMTPAQYTFSPGNKPTPIWIEAEAESQEAMIQLSMKNEKGQIVNDPVGNAEFSLPQREFAKSPGSNPWEIGKWRVDGTLLARQRARWYGEDKFLEKHGGEEFSHISSKQRVDFGETDDQYSVYLSNGDFLIWKDGTWSKPTQGVNTRDYPLLQVKRIDDRIMSFDLWDEDGVMKVSLNLLKSKEPWSPQQIEQDFKFIAARTRSQYVFEVKDERMILRPEDWLVLTNNGWEKLDTEEEIDDYVDRKLVGPLFVFEGVVKKDDKQVLLGTLFNSTRTESQPVELSAPQSSTTVINVPKEELQFEEPFGSGVEYYEFEDE